MSTDATREDPSTGATTGCLSIAFVLPFGEPRQSFFPDAILELCLARARALGHDAQLVRVYYDGRDRDADAAVRAELQRWLAARDADLVVAERLFDPGPIVEHVRAAPERRTAAMLSWGDAEPVEGVEWVVGLSPGTLRRGLTRRSPTGGELVASVEGLIVALGGGSDPQDVPGVARFDGERVRARSASSARELPEPYAPALDHHVICGGTPPPVTRKFLLGNAGCPYAKDPTAQPFYAGAKLPEGSLSRLGCAFCHAGGDYQKRPDARVIERVLEQAAYHAKHVPGLDELVLIDQHPMRYLAPLLRAAAQAKLPPLRWLFSARVDSFLREEDRVRDAIEAARDTSQQLEVFLSGFESFSADELARYNKGVGPDELLEAVAKMRELRASSGGAFEYRRARGHSLILWSPWTTPGDLRQSVEAIRDNGLSEIFSELGRNRLRLYRDLPIHHAAARDGLLSDTWQEGDSGAGRRKGYAVEHPWRFADERTRLAYRLALELRDRLGPRTEIAQLRAILEHVEAGALEGGAARVSSEVAALDDALLELARARGRAPTERASHVAFTGACDNRCGGCAHADRFEPNDAASLLTRVRDARGASPQALLFAGREPCVHPHLPQLVAAARGDDSRAVGLVTNARRLADRGFARALVEAGLRAASVKIFAADAPSADAATGVEGAHAESLAGVESLLAAGIGAIELRVAVRRRSLAHLADCVELARSLGAPRLRLELALDSLGFEQLGPAREAIAALVAKAADRAVAVDASPMSAGTRGFDRIPAPAQARRSRR